MGIQGQNLFRDQDADLGLLEGKNIAVIGYGNQGRAQALNLRDSGLAVIVGNRQDEYAAQAGQDGFEVLAIETAARRADVLMLLIPDEIIPEVFEAEIAPNLREGSALVFASGFNVAFGFVALPEKLDVVLVAPRMIGAGVRDLYAAGRGFPAFFGVAQDHTGQAKALALAIAKGIGATRMGAVEVTFAQEAELDLFTEQCFGPAFGQVLVNAVDLLVEQGYPPEAVLLELYMSGEFSYTLAKMAEMGTVEQSALHSLTSQYGSISRGMRFMIPEIRAKMAEGLEEIRSGAFAREWAAEKEAGYPTLEMLRQAARAMPLHKMESELRQALGGALGLSPAQAWAQAAPRVGDDAGLPVPMAAAEERGGWITSLWGRLRERMGGQPAPQVELPPLEQNQLVVVLDAFLAACRDDPALQAFAAGRDLTVQYSLEDVGQAFYMRFAEGEVSTGLGEPDVVTHVRLATNMQTLDGMFSGRIDAMRAAFSGQLKFDGDTKQAICIQSVQNDLCRLYQAERANVRD